MTHRHRLSAFLGVSAAVVAAVAGEHAANAQTPRWRVTQAYLIEQLLSL